LVLFDKDRSNKSLVNERLHTNCGVGKSRVEFTWLWYIFSLPVTWLLKSQKSLNTTKQAKIDRLWLSSRFNLIDRRALTTNEFEMVAIPDQLTWELVKGHNSFHRMKNGTSKRQGSITFSAEKGNLKSINMFKFSGIANSKAVDVVCTPEHRAQLITKTASKAGTCPKKTTVAINVNKDFRRAESVIVKQTSDVFYRRDLKAASLAKYTKVYQANRRAKGITKPVPVKKGRCVL
jgi:large subunit ribosomal protein L28e